MKEKIIQIKAKLILLRQQCKTHTEQNMWCPVSETSLPSECIAMKHIGIIL